MQAISSPDAPQAIGPYSQGMVVGGLLFSAGQIALDPATMEVVDGGVSEQTDRVMLNLAAVLAADGLSFADVVKTTVYLREMNDFAAMNTVYGGHFKDHHPARSTVAVAGLPRGALVEIDCIAARRT
jgi:2-iminobutanoate/2-iminopropanoate deaminase